jgi:heme-degrading monooxygenase HmoA
MILEIATLPVKPGQETAFEAAFRLAQSIIAAMPGYQWHQLLRGIDAGNGAQYVLLVRWDSLASHEIGFRQAPQYQEWRALLHHFYEPAPSVFHYAPVLDAAHISAQT